MSKCLMFYLKMGYMLHVYPNRSVQSLYPHKYSFFELNPILLQIIKIFRAKRLTAITTLDRFGSY